MPRGPEQMPIDQRTDCTHRHQIHGEGQVRIEVQAASCAEHEHCRRVEEGIDRAHAQQCRSNNTVVDNGLKNQCCHTDGDGRNDHADQGGNSEA